jgi:hypothetical protein
MMELMAVVVVVGVFSKVWRDNITRCRQRPRKKGKVMSRRDLYNPEYFYY